MTSLLKSRISRNLLNKVILFILAVTLVTAGGLGSVTYAQSDEIPKWIKDVADHWINDEITDSEFIQSLQYLVDAGIISIPDSKETNAKKLIDSQASQIERLESDKKKLLLKIQSLKQETKTQDQQQEISENDNYLIERFSNSLYERDFINGFYERLDDYKDVHSALNEACESGDFGSLEKFQIFKAGMKESNIVLKKLYDYPLGDQHLFYYAVYDHYTYHGFPDNPTDFKSKFNNMILIKSMMGLCFESIYEEFGDFEGMEFGGVGIDDKSSDEVFVYLAKKYIAN